MIRKTALAVALLFGVAAAAEAQQGQVTVRPNLGVYTPAFALVQVDDGYNPHVEMGAGPQVGLELGVNVLRPWANVYAGFTAAFSRLHHSGVMELRDVDNHASSRANLYMPTAGVFLAPAIGDIIRGAGDMPFHPTLRLGLGAKMYDFDLYDRSGGLVGDFTGDIGFGFLTGAGPVSYSVEARWAPSTFDAQMLPIRAYGNTDQVQNDWFFQVGLQLQPFTR
jgi:hypothetical protein